MTDPIKRFSEEFELERIKSRQDLGKEIHTQRFPNRTAAYVIGELWTQLEFCQKRLTEATFREDMGR